MMRDLRGNANNTLIAAHALALGATRVSGDAEIACAEPSNRKSAVALVDIAYIATKTIALRYTYPTSMTTALSTDSAPDAPLHGYGEFLVDFKAHIRQRQFQAMRAANHELLALYWWLGESIGQRQATLGWGKAVVETLERDLQVEFPWRNGFSSRNLWNTLDFYKAYADKPKLQPLVAEISWAKNHARCKVVMQKSPSSPRIH